MGEHLDVILTIRYGMLRLRINDWRQCAQQAQQRCTGPWKQFHRVSVYFHREVRASARQLKISLRVPERQLLQNLSSSTATRIRIKRGGVHILLIEDEPKVASALKQGLEADGYRV